MRLKVPRNLLDPRAIQLPKADAEGLVAVQIKQQDGIVRALEPLPEGWDPSPLPLALTPLVEPHAHLDKAFTAAHGPNWLGSMATALEQNQVEYGQRSAEQVLERSQMALERSWRYGTRAIRSHIDSVGAGAEASWEALIQQRQRWQGRVDLQLVALAPALHWLTPEGEALARRVADAGGVLGGVLGPPYAVGAMAEREAIAALLALAERLGCAVDVHVDEADGHPGQGVALITEVALHQRCGLPITCSHASSMALLPDRQLNHLAERMAAAAVAVVACPTTNQWLLGRRPGLTPVLRPQAPIRSLQRAGVRVAVGGDNLQDPWYPGGDGDPLELVRFAMPASHLVPSHRQGLAPFTTTASALLDLAWDGVLRVGGPADLVVVAARSWVELLACSPQRRVLRAGSWLEPPQRDLPASVLAALGSQPP